MSTFRHRRHVNFFNDTPCSSSASFHMVCRSESRGNTVNNNSFGPSLDLGSGASACRAEPTPLFAMKLARALAGRPIRALIGVIHLARARKRGPRNFF